MTTYPRGTVIEWDTEKVAPYATKGRVVLPTCANSGSLERAGECRCAPDPNSPEVIKYREEQAKLEKPKRSPLVAPGFTKLAPLNLAVPKRAPVVKSKTSKKPKAKARKRQAKPKQKQIKKQTRGRR